MKLVFIDKKLPDFKEIDGVMYARTSAISYFFENGDEVLKKEYINGLELADIAVRLSFSNSRKMDALLKLLNIARMMSPELNEINFIYHAATETIMRNFNSSLPTERDVHTWFLKNVKTLVGESYEVTKIKNDKKHIPDLWLKNSGELIPVEMKLREFNESSLRQLLRYMDHYKCHSGVAVGRELSCQIPENINFAEHNLFSA